MTLIRRIPLKVWISVIVIVGLAVYVLLNLETGPLNQRTASTETLPSPGAIKVEPGPAELPSNFQTVAETNVLQLKFDSKTGHFQVHDKRNGNVWYSYPDPEDWLVEKQQGTWRNHLRSPVMFRYIDLTGKISQPKESNLLEEQGTLENVQLIDGGFRLTFSMPSKQIEIPIEVKIENDSVVTKIIDSGVKEGKLSLLWVRLYPFFGAEHSEGQDGYLFIPDGSGALIPYVQDSTNVNRVYQEPVYGIDISFAVNNDIASRKTVKMPVFGAKSYDKAYLAVIEDGAEYVEIIGSPSGVFSGYNWITAQQNYRQSYRQVTNRAKNRSFITYNKDFRFDSDRTVRYILLDKPKANYVGMAERYRQYLIDTYGLKKLQAKDKLPMLVSIIGAERERGLVTDRYLPSTTTSDAMKIVQRLYGLGVENMIVNYVGWQEGGYSNFGAPLKVDKRLGGDTGMKQFVQFANTLDIPVLLQTNYLQNDGSVAGFNDKRHGLRDLGGTVLKSRGRNSFTLVSAGYVNTFLDKELKYFKELGVAGASFEGIGNWVNSDFNTNFPSSREGTRELQQNILKQFKEAGLKVWGIESNFFVLQSADGMIALEDDYSYDSFSSQAVPFAQIALHGLVPYTSQYSNERQEFRKQFLHDLEYGSNPSYVFMYENGEDLKYALELHYFSPSFSDWETTAVAEYQEMNEVLGDVQDQFIVNHRTLAPEVKETTYSNGKRIIVNYGTEPYRNGNIVVGPMDYRVIRGG